jgi:hypothetical protein
MVMQMPISKKNDVYPLFRDFDRKSMLAKLDLWKYDDVKQWADKILVKVENGLMPCDAAWPDAYLESPQKVVPGNKMTYVGLKNPADRTDLVTYRATLK